MKTSSAKAKGRRLQQKVAERIRELPDAEEEFGYEIQLMGQVAGVMHEATAILARSETGSPAISSRAVSSDWPR